jgi:hypothetical protein
MSLPKELLDGGEALVERFGCQSGIFLAATATEGCRDHYWWTREIDEDTELEIKCGDPTLAGKISLINDGYVESYEGIDLTINDSLSVEQTTQIIKAMETHNKQ